MLAYAVGNYVQLFHILLPTTTLDKSFTKNMFLSAIFIFCCGSSMYLFGYFITFYNMDRGACSVYSKECAASALGFTGTFISAMSMVSSIITDIPLYIHVCTLHAARL